jgi:hypothetical protein
MTTGSKTRIEVPAGLTDVDLRALQDAAAMVVSDPPQRAMFGVIEGKHGWLPAAQYAAAALQFANLEFYHGEKPPCLVVDPNEPTIREREGARILRRLLRAGLSRWTPDPLRSLAEVAASQGKLMC